ncbi:MAG: serine protease Do [Verrucomicrobiales bacterium]|jgi:serine protease Do
MNPLPHLQHFTCALALAVGLLPSTTSGQGVEKTGTILVPRGSDWSYLDSGEAPGENWKSAGFDDSAWGSGASPIGYGEDDTATEISFGQDSEDKHAAAYFRQRFDVPIGKSGETTGAVENSYGGRIRFDDGVILFLNGQEIFRMNMGPTGEPGPDTFSTGKVGSRSRWEGRYEKFFVPADALHSGTNVLAAQVHQSDAGSSDLILDFELAELSAEEARREAIPSLFTTRSGEAAEPVPGEEIYLDDLEVVRNIAVKGKRLLADGKTVPGRSLMRDMENNRQHSVFNLPVAREKKLTAAEIYRECVPSVVIISPVSEASDPNNPGEGWGTGFFITASGVAVTNWHVIEAMKEADTITATTFDGKVFPLTKVLAARKDEDIAIVQVDPLGGKMVPLPLVSGAHVGEPVTIISHPRTNFFNLTKGYISRYFKSRANQARLVSVTADIAGGSSGGPILNGRGEVIGIVSMTESLSANYARTATPQDDALPEPNDAPDPPQEEEEDDEVESPSPEQEPTPAPARLVPSTHQMTMKFGAPAISVLELLE